MYSLFENGIKIMQFEVEHGLVTASLLRPDGKPEFVSTHTVYQFSQLIAETIEDE